VGWELVGDGWGGEGRGWTVVGGEGVNSNGWGGDFKPQ
jgi:hypothetical protein